MEISATPGSLRRGNQHVSSQGSAVQAQAAGLSSLLRRPTLESRERELKGSSRLKQSRPRSSRLMKRTMRSISSFGTSAFSPSFLQRLSDSTEHPAKCANAEGEAQSQAGSIEVLRRGIMMCSGGFTRRRFKARQGLQLVKYHAPESLENRASATGSFAGSGVFSETKREPLEQLVLLP